MAVSDHPFIRLVWVITLIYAGPSVGAQPEVRLHTCPTLEVQVLAADLTDVQSACEGAQDALSFFKGLALIPAEQLIVEVVPKLPPQAGTTAVGCYQEEPGRIFILTYAEYLKNKTWFRVSVDRKMYRSLAAHEVAHALAACNFAVREPTIQAKEYVAYVAMFATMDPVVRARVLRAIPGQGFQSESRINEIAYLFDPMRFGAECYRHYLGAGNGVKFLRAVLTGKALAN